MICDILDYLPWLEEKLAAVEIDDIEKFFDQIVEERIDGYLEKLKENLLGDDLWHYHNNHGHIGSLDMCQDETCIMMLRIINNAIEYI